MLEERPSMIWTTSTNNKDVWPCKTILQTISDAPFFFNAGALISSNMERSLSEHGCLFSESCVLVSHLPLRQR